MKDYGFFCGVCNIIIYIALFVVSIIMIINLIEMFVVRFLLIVFSFVLCGYIEEKIISKYVNSFVEYIQKKNK